MNQSSSSSSPQAIPSGSSSPASVTDHLPSTFHGMDPSELPKLPQMLKSQSIPISGMHKTASEVQLCEDEALADYRDFVFYSRLVDGISRQQEQRNNMFLRQENDKCLAHIVSTRHETLQGMSRHILTGMALADDYFCGEDVPVGPDDEAAPAHPSSSDDVLDVEEGIFTLDL